MLRDDAIKAFGAQNSNAEVQVMIGDHLIDIERIEYMGERDAIVLRMRGDDVRDAIGHVVKEKKWWRGSLPGGLDDAELKDFDSRRDDSAS